MLVTRTVVCHQSIASTHCKILDQQKNLPLPPTIQQRLRLACRLTRQTWFKQLFDWPSTVLMSIARLWVCWCAVVAHAVVMGRAPLAGWLPGCVDVAGWLAAWLCGCGWLAGCLAVWMWLAGWLPGCGQLSSCCTYSVCRHVVSPTDSDGHRPALALVHQLALVQRFSISFFFMFSFLNVFVIFTGVFFPSDTACIF